MSRSILRFAALFALTLGVSACGSDRSVTQSLNFVKSLPAQLTGKKAAPQRLTQEQIAQAISATNQPLIFVELESSGAQSLLIQIERNKAHATFATPTRQSIVLRDGIVTSTRGLGGDLMSSDEDALLAAVRGRASGPVPYVLRFLTPEDVTQSYALTCNIARTASAAKAECSGDGVSFTNSFALNSGGRIVSGRQWIGPVHGYVKFSILRG